MYINSRVKRPGARFPFTRKTKNHSSKGWYQRKKKGLKESPQSRKERNKREFLRGDEKTQREGKDSLTSQIFKGGGGERIHESPQHEWKKEIEYTFPRRSIKGKRKERKSYCLEGGKGTLGGGKKTPSDNEQRKGGITEDRKHQGKGQSFA